MYIFSYCVTYKYINWLELCIEFNIGYEYCTLINYGTSGTKGLSQFIKPGGPLVSIYIVTHITNIISGSFFLWSWSQEVISIMPEFPAKKILIFELYSLLMVNWFRFLWTHSMILSTQFCIDSKTKKKVISDNKKSLKWLSDKHACILWSMNSGQEDIAVLFQRASCI